MSPNHRNSRQQLSLFTDDNFIKTYKFYVVNAISEMNITMLEVVLKDEYSYQDTTKELFLEKLNEIFEKHKNNGDTILFHYQGACAAEKKLCSNCGKRGFRFVGNHSNNYLDLIFEMEEDDVKDLCYCTIFETDEKLEDLKNSTSIDINEDDKVTFHKSPEYWIKVNAANDAYSEIITSPTKLLDFEEVCYWVDKHSFTNSKIGDYCILEPEMKWSKFSCIYDDLNQIKIFIANNLQEIIEANKALKLVVSEQDLIDWVIKQEPIIKAVAYDLKYNFEKCNQYFISKRPNYIHLHGNVFNQVFSYLKAFKTHNTALLDKFRVYTFRECIKIDNEREWKENNVDLFSLSFQLKARRELESQGIVVPYFIEKKTDDEPQSEIK